MLSFFWYLIKNFSFKNKSIRFIIYYFTITRGKTLKCSALNLQALNLINGDTNISINRNLLISVYSLKTHIVDTVYQFDTFL